jgi:Ni,Fe-hydrogenase III small subunit
MINHFLKIARTAKMILPVDSYRQTEIVQIGKKINDKVQRLFRGSLAIRHIDAGSDNACEQELVALSNPFYDIERFGIHFVASPRHADMLMITGPITRNMAVAVKRAYDATPEPKIVVTVGDDALDGGIYQGAYAVLGGAATVVPVNYHIPGDPPSPTTILSHLLHILEKMDGTSPDSRQSASVTLPDRKTPHIAVNI